jgi:hypothetical protein
LMDGWIDVNFIEVERFKTEVRCFLSSLLFQLCLKYKVSSTPLVYDYTFCRLHPLFDITHGVIQPRQFEVIFAYK